MAIASLETARETKAIAREMHAIRAHEGSPAEWRRCSRTATEQAGWRRRFPPPVRGCDVRRLKPSFEENRPRTNGRNGQHAVLNPRISREPRADGSLGLALHHEQDVSVVQRPSENDEPLVDKPIHEPSVLVEQLLITQALRPVPRAPMLLVDEQELSHGLKRYAQACIEALQFRAERYSRSATDYSDTLPGAMFAVRMGR